MNAALRQTVVLSQAHSKLDLFVMHYANQAIYSHSYGLIYLSNTASMARLDQNLDC